MPEEIRIRPAEGRRVILPEGGTAADGTPIAPGQDLPAEGAAVARSMFVQRALDDGDAEIVETPSPRPSPASGRGSRAAAQADSVGGGS